MPFDAALKVVLVNISPCALMRYPAFLAVSSLIIDHLFQPFRWYRNLFPDRLEIF